MYLNTYLGLLLSFIFGALVAIYSLNIAAKTQISKTPNITLEQYWNS